MNLEEFKGMVFSKSPEVAKEYNNLKFTDPIGDRVFELLKENWTECKICRVCKCIEFKGFETKERALDYALHNKGCYRMSGGCIFCPHCGRPMSDNAWEMIRSLVLFAVSEALSEDGE